MKPTLFLLSLLIIITWLIIPVHAVIVSFDNTSCGIHIQKDIPVDATGMVKVNITDFPTNPDNCSVDISTMGYVTEPNYYVKPAPTPKYSEEYQQLTNTLTVVSADNTSAFSIRRGSMVYWDMASYYELRRQTILMEKQNELLEEQNGILLNMSYSCWSNLDLK